MDAVLLKDPCRSTEEDYEPLMKLTEQTVPCDKVTGSSLYFKMEAEREEVVGPNINQDEGRGKLWTSGWRRALVGVESVG